MSLTESAPPGEDGKTLGSWVYDRLRDDIVSGDLAPGQKLTLDTLRERYAVGVTPLREALYRLSTSLLVIAEDQRGFRVAGVTPEHLAEILDARQQIETIVLRKALQFGDVAWESRILSAFHQLKKTPMRRPDAPAITREWERAHRSFHYTILSAAGSSIFLHFQNMLWDHAARYRNLVKPVSLEEEKLNKEHERLVSAILGRDEEMACILLRRHILGAAEPVLEAVKRLGAATNGASGRRNFDKN